MDTEREKLSKAVADAAREHELTARLINMKQHAGERITPGLWSKLYDESNVLRAALAALDAHDLEQRPFRDDPRHACRWQVGNSYPHDTRWALVAWCVEDITSRYKCTDEEAVKFLDENASIIQQDMCARGWDSIDTLCEFPERGDESVHTDEF